MYQASKSSSVTINFNNTGIRAPIPPKKENIRSSKSTIKNNNKIKRHQKLYASGSGSGESYMPPTVSDTKNEFMTLYTKPIPSIYNTILLELLVQQHFIRYNKNYNYEPIFALGFLSAFDQIMDGMIETDKNELFNAYIKSLNEIPEQYKNDSKDIEKACNEFLTSGKNLISELQSDEIGTFLEQKIKNSNSRFYSKFFAIGLFRILELTGVKDPKGLEALVKASGVPFESVNRDLKLYKGILTKLSSTKELMKEFLEREKRKTSERLSEKIEASKQEFKKLLF